MEHDTRIRYRHFPSSVYSDREGRNRFVGEHFKECLSGKVVNVGGGGKKHLASWLPHGCEYTEIDVAGQPDIFIDLEKNLPIPFEDGSFDAVVCTDVLEHLDNFHAVFDELCRLSRRYVIISLPNAWASNKWRWVRGTGASGKFYGLPSQAPVDRHKWFFSFSEAEKFLIERSSVRQFRPVHWAAIGYVGASFPGRLMRSLASIAIGETGRLNLFAGTIWVLLERVDGSVRY
jgi:SAM-dependent methyltransferase